MCALDTYVCILHIYMNQKSGPLFSFLNSFIIKIYVCAIFLVIICKIKITH